MGWIFGKKNSPMTTPLGGKRTPSIGAGTGTATTATRHPVEPPPTVPAGQSAPASIPRVEEVGEAVVGRLVDPSASDFKILGRAKLYKPGDVVQFFVQAISVVKADGTREPVPNLPVEVHNKAQKRQLGPTVKTDTVGVAIVSYTVQEEDMIGDPDSPEPDMGSYICIAYVRGRMLNKVVVLWDAY